VWDAASFGDFGGKDFKKLGKPTIIETPIGNAIAFNGKSDAIFVNSNPLMDLSQFTVEVIFQPDSGGLKEQRFLHMGENHDQFCE
jgi:hypothetical protein